MQANQEGHVVVVVSVALVGRRRPSRSLRGLLIGTSTRAPFLPPCHLSGSHRVRPPRPCAAPNPAVPQPHNDDKSDMKLKKHLQELEQMLDQIVSEHVKLHRLVHSSDRGYFESRADVQAMDTSCYLQ
uniref:Uncharacterized protein n=1 Tax=Oryza meridionalis TaxID=40149 RepID=A0A0E0CET8_9ORYZ